jgi:hypothetical protein
MVRALHGSKGLEKTKVREQVVDKINESLGSHGGDTGSKPVGTASNIKQLLSYRSFDRFRLLTPC